jgi:hypothetical protein
MDVGTGLDTFPGGAMDHSDAVVVTRVRLGRMSGHTSITRGRCQRATTLTMFVMAETSPAQEGLSACIDVVLIQSTWQP